MPFAILIVGLLLIIAGARDKTGELGGLIAGDFSGSGNFLIWGSAVAGVGSLGYVSEFRNVSRVFLGLIILSMLISDKGFFTQFYSAISTAQAPSAAPESAVGQATADIGNAVTGPVAAGSAPTDQQSNVDNTPIPPNFVMPLGAPSSVKTLNDLQNWQNSLPATATFGPSQQYPYVAPNVYNSSLTNGFDQYATGFQKQIRHGMSAIEGVPSAVYNFPNVINNQLDGFLGSGPP